MSKKENYIKEARDALIEHKKWVNQVRLVVSGLEKKRDAIALNPSESPFGVWLYSKATIYSISNSKLVLNDIERLFNECYEEYYKIYAYIFKEQKSGFLYSIFGQREASLADYKVAQKNYENLIPKSDQLLKKLTLFQNQLRATNFEKFERALPEMKSNEEPLERPKQKEQRYYRGSLIED